MATFFDQKQDVIDIELTKYGEYLLSLGKFNPVYYSFFDNNVLYDTRYAGYSGSQNSLEGRIQNETPSLRTQHSFEGRGEQVMNYVAAAREDLTLREDQKIRFPSTPDKNFTGLYQPLGHSDLTSVKAPAWKMRFYHNKMLNWATHYTGSRYIQDIPQIDATIKYKTRVTSIGTPDPEATIAPTLVYAQTEFADDPLGIPATAFSDGNYVIVEPDYILIDLQEINSLFESENFDIEIYEMSTETLPNSNTRDNLIPLKFQETPLQIVDNILVDRKVENIAPDPTFVEHFFSVLVDEEIDEAIVCKSLNNLKVKGLYLDTEFNCPDISTSTQIANIYPPEDIESEKCSTDGTT